MIREDLAGIPAYVPGKHAPDALKLSSNESALPPLAGAVAAMSVAAEGSNRYPDLGAVALREALSEHLGLSEHTAVTVGTGSSALCQQLAQVTSQPGDEIIFPWRSFEAYPIFAQIAGATPVAVPLTETGEHDLDAMADAITEHTRLIFLCSPNNPSGQVITNEQFNAFMARVPEDVVVGLDEAYIEYNRDETAVLGTEVVEKFSNVVALRTFSKAYGLAGVRVGYAFGPAALIEALDKVAVPFSVSSVAQAGAIASLAAADELLERTDETVAVRDRVADELGALRSQGNFVWLPGVDAGRLAAALAERGVLARAFPEGLRVSVTTAAESETLIDAWKALSCAPS